MHDIVRKFAQALYEDRDYRFWAYQLGGWAGYSLATFVSITVMDNNVHWDHVFHIALQAFLGILMTWPLRPIYRLTFESPLPTRVVVSSLAILVFSAIWTALRIYSFTLISGETGLWREFHYWYFGSLFVFLSWTVLYYGIHYYELLVVEHQKLLEESTLREKERSRRLEAEAAARESQLRMLRYQLNPHFLFNTLNAINAYVRLGENDNAGNMIQYLSRFLRHTLEQDSIDDIPLSREIESLMLYLNIEQARFGDRLELTVSITPEAEDALVPSLILQPIVENAMKYAIAPFEEGGAVEIRGVVREDMLELKVTDTGPGIDEPRQQESRGIGLSNTLNRLKALYGSHYEFTTTNLSPAGLEVAIRIPFRTGKQRLQVAGAQ